MRMFDAGSPKSVENAFAILDADGVSDYQVLFLKEKCHFGEHYNRAVADNIDRALVSLLKHRDRDQAIKWYERANVASFPKTKEGA